MENINQKLSFFERIRRMRESPREDWEQPIQFINTDLPGFPVACLPSWLGNYVNALAISTQTPPDLAGCLSLAVVSLTVAKVAEVQVYPDWQEPLNLWTAVFLDPSTLKSPVLKALSEPVKNMERTRIESERATIAEQKQLRTLQEERIKKLIERAARPDLPDAEHLKTETDIKQLARELDNMIVPPIPRLLVADVTAEKLVSLLAEQAGERIGILSAEGGMTFSLMAGRYCKGANFDIYLSAYSGEAYIVDRRGRAESLDKPALIMGLAAQPSVIHGMAADREYRQFRERGLLARFLYSVPASKLGSRTFDAYYPIPDDMQTKYYRNVMRLLQLPVGQTPQIITLARDAQEQYKVFRCRLENRIVPDGDLGALTDWAGKLHGQVIRLAGVLHMAGQPDNPYPWQSPISGQTMAAAITLGEYFAEHAKAAFGSMAANKVEPIAKKIWKWMQQTGLPSIKRRDIQQRFKNSVSSTKELDEALAILESQYLIKPVIDIFDKRRGKKIKSYEINPQPISPLSPISYKHSDYETL